MVVTLKDGFVPLELLKDLVDISKVLYYSVKEKDGSFYLKLYDKQKRLIKPNVCGVKDMPKKKPAKSKSSVGNEGKKSKSKHLVLYVEDCSMKGKTFKDVKSMNAFIDDFKSKYPNPPEQYQDDWIELIVTDIKGEITCVDDSLEIK